MSVQVPYRRSRLSSLPGTESGALEKPSFCRRISTDSSSTFDLSVSEAWTCGECSYRNVDGRTERCALCGTTSSRGGGRRRRAFPTPASLLASIDDGAASVVSSASLPSSIAMQAFADDHNDDETVLTSPSKSTAARRASQGPLPNIHDEGSVRSAASSPAVDRRTRMLLGASGGSESSSTRSLPVTRRPTSAEEEDDAAMPHQPSMPLSASRRMSAPKTVGPSLTGSSLGALVRQTNNTAPPLPPPKPAPKRDAEMDEEASRTSAATNHSRQTVRTSNRSCRVRGGLPPPPPEADAFSSASTPTLSNGSRHHDPHDATIPEEGGLAVPPLLQHRPSHQQEDETDDETSSSSPHAAKNDTSMKPPLRQHRSIPVPRKDGPVFRSVRMPVPSSRFSSGKRSATARGAPDRGSLVRSGSSRSVPATTTTRSSTAELMPPVRMPSERRQRRPAMETLPPPARTPTIPRAARSSSPLSGSRRSDPGHRRRESLDHPAPTGGGVRSSPAGPPGLPPPKTEPEGPDATTTNHTTRTISLVSDTPVSVFADESMRDNDVERGGYPAADGREPSLGTAGEEETTRKTHRLRVSLLSVGVAALLVIVLVLSILLAGNNNSSSNNNNLPSGPSQSEDPTGTGNSGLPVSEGGGAVPVVDSVIDLRLVGTLAGEANEELGSSVSVGGPQGNWIAVVAGNSVRVVMYRPTDNELGPVGTELGFSSDVQRVSLSAERRRLAVAHNGRISVYQHNLGDGNEEWVGLVDGDMIGMSEASKTTIPTTCAISGSGLIAVGGAILPTNKGTSVFVQPYYLDGSSDNTRLPLPSPFSVDTNVDSIRVTLSYEGDILAILAGNSIRVYRISEYSEAWENFGEQTVFSAKASSSANALALSADGELIAVVSDDETVLYAYHSETNDWRATASSIPIGGTDIALSHDGKDVIIGSQLGADNLGTVSLWDSRAGSSSNIDGGISLEGDVTGPSFSSNFGESVSIPKNRQPEFNLVAVGASKEGGRNNGSLFVYEKAIATSDGVGTRP